MKFRLCGGPKYSKRESRGSGQGSNHLIIPAGGIGAHSYAVSVMRNKEEKEREQKKQQKEIGSVTVAQIFGRKMQLEE